MEDLCQKIVEAEVDIVLNGSLHSIHPIAADYLWTKGHVLSIGRLSS